MNDLREVVKAPAFLSKHGFERRDQETTDPVRWVWFERTFDMDQSQVRFVLQVEFELCIHDDVGVSYTDNRDYSFNAVYLEVIDRQMERRDNISYDEETEMPRSIDQYRLKVHTMGKLESLCEMLEGELQWILP